MHLRRARSTLKYLVKAPTQSTSKWLANPYVRFKARSLLSSKLSEAVTTSAEEYLSSIEARSSAGFAGIADAVASMVVAQSLSIYDALDSFLAARSAALHRACQLLLSSSSSSPAATAAPLLASMTRLCDLLVESVCASRALFCGDEAPAAAGPLLHTLLRSCLPQHDGLGRALEEVGTDHWTEALESWLSTQTAAVRAAAAVALQAPSTPPTSPRPQPTSHGTAACAGGGAAADSDLRRI